MAIERLDDEPGRIDLLVGGELQKRVSVHPGKQTIELELPGVRTDIELWLPQSGITRVGALELMGATHLSAHRSHQTNWIAYGSLITQCVGSAGPSATWPAVVARTLGWDLTCMGFDGQCFLDDVAVMTMSKAPADVVTICAGINIYNRGEWGTREFATRLERFVRTVLSGQPDVPVILMSPLALPSRETTKNAAGVTLADIRLATLDLAKRFKADGVHYLNGLDVLGIEDQNMLHDGLHPSAAGYLMMSDRLHPILSSITAPIMGAG